jgi:hypothetical protein
MNPFRLSEHIVIELKVHIDPRECEGEVGISSPVALDTDPTFSISFRVLLINDGEINNLLFVAFQHDFGDASLEIRRPVRDRKAIKVLRQILHQISFILTKEVLGDCH